MLMNYPLVSWFCAYLYIRWAIWRTLRWPFSISVQKCNPSLSLQYQKRSGKNRQECSIIFKSTLSLISRCSHWFLFRSLSLSLSRARALPLSIYLFILTRQLVGWGYVFDFEKTGYFPWVTSSVSLYVAVYGKMMR